MTTMTTAPYALGLSEVQQGINKAILRLWGAKRLPNGGAWTNRFEVHTNNTYIISQSKNGRWWACGCRGWITHKNCKHLKALGLPGSFVPLEVKLEL